jgi:hypothetical protein
MKAHLFIVLALATSFGPGIASVVCERTKRVLPSWGLGKYLTIRCDSNPYATRLTHSIVNPDGFVLTVTVADGANDCAPGAGSAAGAKPENSYTSLGLSNVTFFNGPCNQVPCCIKISCTTKNSQNCSNVSLGYVFENDLPAVGKAGKDILASDDAENPIDEPTLF